MTTRDEDTTEAIDPRMVAARDAALALLDTRAAGATVCPSEVARALAASIAPVAADWRGMMPVVHAAVDELTEAGAVRLSWKGERLAGREGPYRIGRPARR